MSYQDDGGPADKATLRDLFVGMVIQGMLAAPGGKFPEQLNGALCVRDAFAIADEMLEARKK